MKHSFRCGVLFIFLLSLIAFSHTSARFLHTKSGENMVKLDESIHTSLLDFNEVMELEECGNTGDEDEECLKRRVLADVHLDYIYTQHHKP